jgi:hypothetical protein
MIIGQAVIVSQGMRKIALNVGRNIVGENFELPLRKGLIRKVCRCSENRRKERRSRRAKG